VKKGEKMRKKQKQNIYCGHFVIFWG